MLDSGPVCVYTVPKTRISPDFPARRAATPRHRPMIRDNDLSFFLPLWRRVLVLAVLLVWTAFEWAMGDTFWGTLVTALTAYVVWTLFINFDRRVAQAEAKAQKAKDAANE